MEQDQLHAAPPTETGSVETPLLTGAAPPTSPEPAGGNTVQAFLADLAEKLGEDVSSIKVQHHTQSMLERMKQGAIVQLRISRPRFSLKSTLEHLGFTSEHLQGLSQAAENTIKDYFKLGRHSLLPKEYQDRFQAAENSARYNLNRYAVKTAWGYFVATTVYPDWKAAHLVQAEEFWTVVEDLRTNYDVIKEEVLGAYRALAEDLWSRLMVSHSLSQQPDLPLSLELWNDLATRLRAKEGKEAFVTYYVELVEKAIPDRSILEDDETWTFATEVTAIPLPSMLAQDMLQADRTVADHAIKDAKARAELEKVQHQRELDRIRVQREQIRLDEERWRSQQQLTMQEREARRLQDERIVHERERLRRQRMVEEDVLASARADKRRLVNDFYRDVVARLNELLKETMDQVLTSLNENRGTLRGPTSTQLTQLIERLEKLNFINDETIETQIARLKAVLPTPAAKEAAKQGIEKIDTRPIERVVRQIQQETQEILVELGATTAQRTKRQRSAPLIEEGLIDLGARRARPGAVLKGQAGAGNVRQPRPGKVVK